MKDLINYIVKVLVDQPEKVCITEIESDQTKFIGLSVAKSDLENIIGGQGQNLQAIRTILNAASRKTRKRYVLEIVE